MTRTILVSNESTVVSDAEAAAAVAAIQVQIDKDFSPAYSGLTATLVFWPRSKGAPPAGQEIVHILDTSDVANALGYHELAPGGYAQGFCFAKTSQEAGDAWQTTLSHEILEQLLDPQACWTSQAHLNGFPVWVTLEACDAVEGDGYLINGVPVSNFVLPAWFQGVKGKVDFLGKLTQGLTLDAGGYIGYADGYGNWQQITGDLARVPAGAPKFSRKGRYLLNAHNAARGIPHTAALSLGTWISVISTVLEIAPTLIEQVSAIVKTVSGVLPAPAGPASLTP